MSTAYGLARRKPPLRYRKQPRILGTFLALLPTMPNPHPILDPLRAALREKMETKSLRSIADGCAIDYRRMLTFSQGGIPEFDVLDLERLALSACSHWRNLLFRLVG